MNVSSLNRLISTIESLRSDQFDIRYMFRSSDGQDAGQIMPDMSIRGTAACIAGACAIALGQEPGAWWSTEDAGMWLDLPPDEWRLLSEPEGFESENQDYTLRRALEVLYYLRSTGKISWEKFTP